jgi:hypothetical protein
MDFTFLMVSGGMDDLFIEVKARIFNPFCQPKPFTFRKPAGVVA